MLMSNTLYAYIEQTVCLFCHRDAFVVKQWQFYVSQSVVRKTGRCSLTIVA